MGCKFSPGSAPDVLIAIFIVDSKEHYLSDERSMTSLRDCVVLVQFFRVVVVAILAQDPVPPETTSNTNIHLGRRQSCGILVLQHCYGSGDSGRLVLQHCYGSQCFSLEAVKRLRLQRLAAKAVATCVARRQWSWMQLAKLPTSSETVKTRPAPILYWGNAERRHVLSGACW